MDYEASQFITAPLAWIIVMQGNSIPSENKRIEEQDEDS